MSGPQTALLAMVVLPATVGGVLALARPHRGAVPIALVTSGLTTVLAFATALARPAVSYPFVMAPTLPWTSMPSRRWSCRWSPP